MINFLPLAHLVEDVLLDVVISPAKIEIHARDRISNKRPLEFLGNLPHNSVLSFFISQKLQATLMTILG